MTARDKKALAGVAAAAVALGVTQLVAVAFGPEADARTAVGSAVIDLTPGPVKECAIQTFGTADKLVLSLLVLAVIGVIAAVAGAAESRRVPIGSAAIVARRHRRVRSGAVACGRDDGRHRAHARRNRLWRRGIAAADLGPVHRRTGARRCPRRC